MFLDSRMFTNHTHYIKSCNLLLAEDRFLPAFPRSGCRPQSTYYTAQLNNSGVHFVSPHLADLHLNTFDSEWPLTTKIVYRWPCQPLLRLSALVSLQNRVTSVRSSLQSCVDVHLDNQFWHGSCKRREVSRRQRKLRAMRSRLKDKKIRNVKTVLHSNRPRRRTTESNLLECDHTPLKRVMNFSAIERISSFHLVFDWDDLALLETPHGI